MKKITMSLTAMGAWYLSAELLYATAVNSVQNPQRELNLRRGRNELPRCVQYFTNFGCDLDSYNHADFDMGETMTGEPMKTKWYWNTSVSGWRMYGVWIRQIWFIGFAKVESQ